MRQQRKHEPSSVLRPGFSAIGDSTRGNIYPMTIARSLTLALEFSSHLPEFGAAVSVNNGSIQSSALSTRLDPEFWTRRPRPAAIANLLSPEELPR
jgi:hypothetical protein